jgi:hypothetical protein
LRRRMVYFGASAPFAKASAESQHMR